MNDQALLLQQAVRKHHEGDLRSAAELYVRVLRVDARQADALHLFGVALIQGGQTVQGADLIRRSLEVRDAQPAAHANLGNAEFSLNNFQQALSSYERAISLQPANPPAFNGRANALLALGRVEEALRSFERALELDPNFAEAAGNRGVALLKLNRVEEALASLDRSLVLRPADARVLTARAIAHEHLGLHEEALADADRALGVAPDFADAWHCRITALIALWKLPDALADIERRMTAAPQDPKLLVLRSRAQAKLGRSEAALKDLEAALKLQPDMAEAGFELGMLAVVMQQYERATHAFSHLVTRNACHEYLDGAHLHAKLQCLDWREFDACALRVIDGVRRNARVDLPLSFNAVCDEPQLQLQCARTYVGYQAGRAVAPARPLLPAGSRIKIAYLSADFVEHPVAYLITRLLELHDRRQFEVIAYSWRDSPGSAAAARVRTAVDQFIDLSQRADAEVAQMIREAGTHVAIDLMGHTAAHRIGILAGRPAGVQVNYLGFPGTMGCKHIDYIIADGVVIPAGMERHYSEKVVRLPHTFQVNDANRTRPSATARRCDHGLPEDGLVVAAFHASYKINPPLFDTWCRILKTLPDSVLWLVSGAPAAELHLREAAARRGVDPSRLRFAARVAYTDHLERLTLADLCLDTWPFNGGATTSDALWCAVPVVTRAGGSFSSRMSASLLDAVGLAPLTACTFEEYEAIAVDLARDQGRRRQLRAALLDARDTSPLFDTGRFRTHIEQAYRMMWERFAAGEPPADIRIAG
jgi:predicted O-linked N-acetylglucosamine transferase (SPINDLY family)